MADPGRMELVWAETCEPPLPVVIGEGFGTSFVKRSIEYEMEGQVTVEPTPTGSRWTIVLPSKETSRTAEVRLLGKERLMSAALRGCRILVVEDNFLLAETLCDLLEDCGREPIGPAPRVSVALPLCTADLHGALLDINLGKETCFEIADRLAEQGVPFMFLSGYSDGAVVPGRFNTVPRLPKPYDRLAIVHEAEQRFRR